MPARRTLANGMQLARNGSLGNVDPATAGDNKRRLSKEQQEKLSNNAARWLFSTKNAASHFAESSAARGTLSDSEFDEFLMRAGDTSPTVCDLGRWRYVMAKVENCLGKSAATKYLNAICRWKQHDKQEDAELVASIEAYIRANLIPQSGPVADSTVALARSIEASTDALVEARNAAAQALGTGCSSEDFMRTRGSLFSEASNGQIMPFLSLLVLQGMDTWPQDSHGVEAWLSRAGCNGLCQPDLTWIDALHCGTEGLDAFVASMSGHLSLEESPISLESFQQVKDNRHWSFCRPLFKTRRTYHIDTERGISVVFDIRFVFESAKGAKRFVQRGLNYLAENHVYDSFAECADRVNHGVAHKQVEGAPCWGDESFLFGGDDDEPFNVICKQSGAGQSEMSFLNAIVRIRNVVAKMFVLVPGPVSERTADIFALVSHGSERLSAWERRFGGECAGAVLGLPKPARVAYNALLAAHQVLAQLALKAAASGRSVYVRPGSEQCCANCGVRSSRCKRCGGCYRHFLCGSACQRAFWELGHKAACSREFKLTPLADSTAH